MRTIENLLKIIEEKRKQALNNCKEDFAVKVSENEAEEYADCNTATFCGIICQDVSQDCNGTFVIFNTEE